jgi:metal-responsive CopG/Arc/MetJ family transcriptional regulator
VTLLIVKVTVSIPDAVFQAAERLAKRMGLPRSRLYAIAVKTCLASQSDTAITKKLNRVYAKASSSLEPAMEAANLELLRRERWD